MSFSALLFELTNRLPSIEYMYASGAVLAFLVFAATYFHNQIGLMTLLFVGLLCAQNLENSGVFDASNRETAQNYITHWNYSSRMTFVLSVVLFFTAIVIKRRRKRKGKPN